MQRWLSGLVVVIAACKAPVGVENVELPRDSAAQCAAQCTSIGLALDAVVVMANNVGCVCRAAPPAGASASATGGSSAGGLTAVLIQMEEAERQRAQQAAATAAAQQR